MNAKQCITSLVLLFMIAGCSTATQRAQKSEKMTVAAAQREIKIGMPSSAVVEALGSPNMVTTDEQRREVWVYDRISRQVDGSSSSKGIWLVLAGASSQNSSYTTSDRTLTIIVKFDDKGQVRDFAYRSSSF